MFFLVELKQVRLSRSFSQRCLRIEQTVSRLLRHTSNGSRLPEFISLHFVPGLANHLQREYPREFTRDHSLKTIITNADNWFYFTEAFVVGLVLLVLHFYPAGNMRIRDQTVIFNGSNSSLSDRPARSQDIRVPVDPTTPTPIGSTIETPGALKQKSGNTH